MFLKLEIKLKYLPNSNFFRCHKHSLSIVWVKHFAKLCLFLFLYFFCLDASGLHLFKPELSSVKAANFKIKTGYYVGNGTTQSIVGLGFSPQAVIIKSSTANGTGVWKSSLMPANTTAYFSAVANDSSSMITLSTDGFSLSSNTNVNSLNTIYYWVSIAGSECTSTGTFCVGTYTGNGATSRTITAGFQPSFVMIKSSSTVGGNFAITASENNRGEYFSETAADTTGGLFSSFTTTGFNIGLTNNSNSIVHYYLAFKTVTGIMASGSYSGTGSDNRSITGFGIGSTPNFVLVKNSTSAISANRRSVINFKHSFGDNSSYVSGNTSNVVNMIQKLQSDGFQVGSGANVNESGSTFYWLGFGGATSDSASGTFSMQIGRYVGNGTSQSVNLRFAPDLVIIKDSSTSYAVFRTSMMKGDSTAYFAAPIVNFATGITAMSANSFSIGASSSVNTSGRTYYWEAYGNAWNPNNHLGSNEFAVGAYYGNGVGSRLINGIPFQPDLVSIKTADATEGVWRTSSMAGDLTAFFSATGESTNNIQAINAGGFQVGTSASVNAASAVHWWFAFKNGANFTNNSYVGTGASQNITSAGFKPEFLWVKNTTAVRAVVRSSSLTGNFSQVFLNAANISNAITAFLSNGFTIATSSEVNSSATNYHYAAWKRPSTITIGTNGAQRVSLTSPSTNNYIGAAFTLFTDVGLVNVAQIKVNDAGSINANTKLKNLKLYYEIAGNCIYDGNESLFGSVSIFDVSEQAVINGSMPVGTSQVCVYPVFDINSGANNTDTIEFEIASSSGLTHSNGFVNAIVWPVSIAGTTAVQVLPTVTVEIVDSSGVIVSNPTIAMTVKNLTFNSQTSSGTFGSSNQKVRVSNSSAIPQWTLSIGATGGSLATWSSGTNYFDFNDNITKAIDGSDADSYGGQLTINPSAGDITPKTGCASIGITLGSQASFVQDTVNNITVATANSTANTNCYWDFTGIALSQTIPAQQNVGTYSIDMTLTITAN